MHDRDKFPITGRHARISNAVRFRTGNIATILAAALCLGCLTAGHATTEAAAEGGALADSRSPATQRTASFLEEFASKDAHRVADWVVASGDNRGLPFVIVDKTNAKVFVFDNEGRLQGAAPALIGLALGDNSVAGIGDRKLSDIRPEERTTPAGRFVAMMGNDLGPQDVLWVDYDDAISLHRVITTNPKERRLQRLATATPLDNRISYGCINVPAKFFDSFVKPAFAGTNGIVYILPETRSIRDFFPAIDDQ